MLRALLDAGTLRSLSVYFFARAVGSKDLPVTYRRSLERLLDLRDRDDFDIDGCVEGKLGTIMSLVLVKMYQVSEWEFC